MKNEKQARLVADKFRHVVMFAIFLVFKISVSFLLPVQIFNFVVCDSLFFGNKYFFLLQLAVAFLLRFEI